MVRSTSRNKGIQVFGGSIEASQIAVGKRAKAAVQHVHEASLRGEMLSPDQSRESTDKLVILFLAANPPSVSYSTLRLDEEAREILAKIRGAEFRDSIELVTRWAVRPDDLLQALNEVKPSIVHFSGHGSQSGEVNFLGMEGRNQPVRKEALLNLFVALRSNVRVVVLGSCYSYALAEEIAGVIDCAVGMSAAIGDDSAIVFSASFYRALAFGQSLQQAFDQGSAALLLEGFSEADVPKIIARSGVDLSTMKLVNSR